MIKKVKEIKLAVIGLGYVGLPLSVEFAKKQAVIGFDINKQRINEIKHGIDSTLEVSRSEILKAKFLSLTSNKKELKDSNCYIITVPTPIDKFKKPQLNHLIKATQTVGEVLNLNDIIIYESTVYPGATEEVCVPILEKFSGLKFNKDFYCGYSPERINPGDKKHRLTSIKKITSGSNPKIANLIDKLYNKIISAGTYKVSSIKIAEAAKVIENTQRDLNIALINELAIIFNKMNIDTESVLKAAGTKWNFLPFKPGFVGGHCIGVDPYYLTFKAKEIKYNPKIILAGRNLNDGMGKYVASKLMKMMKKKKINIKGSKILIMGLTFKENCPDVRNTRVVDLVKKLKSYKSTVDVHDPVANKSQSQKQYFIKLKSHIKKGTYDAIVLAVAHNKFKDLGIKKIRSFGKSKSIVYDLKYLFKKSETDLRL